MSDYVAKCPCSGMLNGLTVPPTCVICGRTSYVSPAYETACLRARVERLERALSHIADEVEAWECDTSPERGCGWIVATAREALEDK